MSAYWIVNNKKFKNRFAALDYAAETKQTIDFNFHRESFSSIDWAVEPSESWPNMLANRAQQLRDRYKYLRLWYSGGADSHTVLNTFIDNNIHLDEIITWRSSPTDEFDSYSNTESNAISIPYLKSIKYIIPKTKIRVLDIGNKQYMNFYSQDAWQRKTSFLELTPDSMAQLYEAFPMELDRTSNYCDIQGGDKPKIVRKDEVFYAPLVDTQFTININWPHCEDFFTTPNYPDLHAKQCHLLKHVIKKKYPDPTVDLLGPELYDPQTITQEWRNEWYGCCRILYKQEFMVGKGWTINGPKGLDNLFTAEQKAPDVIKYYKGALNEEFKFNKDDFFEEGGDIEIARHGIFSDFYCLGR